jgi:hypothetical protein
LRRRRASAWLAEESAAKTGVAERPEPKTGRGARWDKIEVRWRTTQARSPVLSRCVLKAGRQDGA